MTPDTVIAQLNQLPRNIDPIARLRVYQTAINWFYAYTHVPQPVAPRKRRHIHVHGEAPKDRHAPANEYEPETGNYCQACSQLTETVYMQICATCLERAKAVRPWEM